MLLDQLLHLTKEKNASDLHIGELHKPFLRINGDLTEQKELKVLDKQDLLEIADTLGAKNNTDFSLAYAKDLRFRVHAYCTQKRFNFAFHLLPLKIPSSKELGIPQSFVDSVMQESEGLFIVSGPTGSGKSTTIASLIDLLNQTKNLHIVTLEDPIEYIFENKKSLIKQREVGKPNGDVKTFAAALRNALREDPDVIFVGEMRDTATIRLALRAAETGHLVCSTLHASYASQIPSRIINAFTASQGEQIRHQLMYVFRGAIAQRLLPRKDGSGRVAAFEVLFANDAVRNLIKENKLQGVRDVMKTSKNSDNFRHGIFEPASKSAQEMVLLEEAIDKLRTQGIID